MVIYPKIRRMHFREHLTISEIQRRTSLSRNTIKKWLKEVKEPHYQRRKRDSKLTPFEPRLKLANVALIYGPWKRMHTAPSGIVVRQRCCMKQSGRMVTRVAMHK